MKPKELAEMGVPKGKPLQEAIQYIKDNIKERSIRQIEMELRSMMHHSNLFDHPFAKAYNEWLHGPNRYEPRKEEAPWEMWGTDLDPNAIDQMKNACSLPVAVAGALMPDAHLGYGLPIGGVLATENAVIPYAVGVDIACRMKLSVFDLPADTLEKRESMLINTIENQTRFGTGCSFDWDDRRKHDVMDQDWSITDITKEMKDKAWAQLGTSGGGNHFVEFGIFTLDAPDFGLEAGDYLALLSHSGSRGVGANVANFYSKLAKEKCSFLPKELQHLSWLDMNTAEGLEYWNAMNLMGDYAAANHDCIHRYIKNTLCADTLLNIENHHNFAWKENHFGKDLYVHRKGATPAGKGVLGVIPASMADVAYIVEGRGKPESLCSASHGAGRRMSRKQAKLTISQEEADNYLAERNVKLLSAGLDESPMAYKDINEVMANQMSLVNIRGRFQPRLVKMAKDENRKEKK